MLRDTLRGHADRHGVDVTIDLMIAETDALNAEIDSLKAERDAALAACAEMRAALVEIIARGQEQRGTGRMIETAEAALARPDLGAGMVVVPRERLKAEIARLNLRVAQLTSGSEAANLAGRVVERDKEIARLKGELTDADQVTQDALGHARAAWEGERKRLEADLAAHKRALAAGPAALRRFGLDGYELAAFDVEAAQAAAMKEET